MNKKTQPPTNKPERKGILGKLNGKVKDILLLAVLAIALLFAAWKIFHTDNSDSTPTTAGMSEAEVKVIRLLQEIDGVGDANVVVCETEEGIQSVVVVCEGANDIRVIMDVREAVAAALGTEQKTIKIYQKKE